MGCPQSQVFAFQSQVQVSAGVNSWVELACEEPAAEDFGRVFFVRELG